MLLLLLLLLVLMRMRIWMMNIVTIGSKYDLVRHSDDIPTNDLLLLIWRRNVTMPSPLSWLRLLVRPFYTYDDVGCLMSLHSRERVRVLGNPLLLVPVVILVRNEACRYITNVCDMDESVSSFRRGCCWLFWLLVGLIFVRLIFLRRSYRRKKNFSLMGQPVGWPNDTSFEFSDK